MNHFPLAITFAVIALQGATSQDIAGDWQGTLNIGAGQLHLLVHITGTNGNLRATLDSLDQNATGIPISTVTLQDSKLTFRSEAIQGAFEGTVDSSFTSIKGAWTQGDSIPLTLTRAVKPSDLDGAWEGSLDVGQKLRLIFHLTTTKDGLQATMDSPDQEAYGLAVSSTRRDGTALTLEMPTLAAKFQGAIAPDLAAIDGKFTQGGATFPLVLKRPATAKPPEVRHPQVPAKPYPYRAEEVAYDNPRAAINLAGTLTIPTGKGPFPAAILITGSGQQDRDESILGHKPFLVLADSLTRKGIAVLRSDDRGAGSSGGDFAAATTADFATDVESALAYLKTRPEVDSHKIGLIGHSEGGVIAPMVAASNRDVAFIILLAGTGVSGDQVIASQVVAAVEAAGAGPDAARKAGEQEKRILAIVEAGGRPAAMKQKLSNELSLSGPQLDVVYGQLTSPWYRYFLIYDPATALRKVSCPVLALNGDKDTQVVSKLNLPAIRKALEEAGNKRFETLEMPGLNHLFQHAKTGAVNEYANIEETMSPDVLDKIANWTKSVVLP